MGEQVRVETDLVADVVAVIEGNTCIVLPCTDFDHFKKLPAVISYNGVKCGKTGWNSDTNRVHYQSNAIIVQVVP